MCFTMKKREKKKNNKYKAEERKKNEKQNCEKLENIIWSSVVNVHKQQQDQLIKNVIQKNQWKIQGRKLRIKGKTKNRRNNMFKERKQIVEEKIKDFHWSYEKK